MSVPGLSRGIAILRLFRRDRTELSAPRIAAELRIPRSTVHRLLVELVELGLLRRAGEGRFGLAAGVLTLGYEYLASAEITTLAEPILENLRDRTNWSAHLAVRQDRTVVYLSRFASRSALTRNVVVGTSLPAHATLIGRVLLADLELAELRVLYENCDFGPGKGPDDIAGLEEMLMQDRARGHVASDGYFEAGVPAIAAPVCDGSLRVVAAINLVANAPVDDAVMAQATHAVREAAAELSRFLGSPPPRAEGIAHSSKVQDEVLNGN